MFSGKIDLCMLPVPSHLVHVRLQITCFIHTHTYTHTCTRALFSRASSHESYEFCFPSSFSLILMMLLLGSQLNLSDDIFASHFWWILCFDFFFFPRSPGKLPAAQPFCFLSLGVCPSRALTKP